jgi:hypothetical protein
MTESHKQQAGASEHYEEDTCLYAPCRTLECIGANSLGRCYLLAAPLGLRPDSYDSLRRFLSNLVSHFVAYKGCEHESYVALHQAKARMVIELFADHAPVWLPETILGVWTHLPAPRMMTAEALMEMNPESPTSVRMDTLFRVSAGASACLDAMEVMTGTGTGIQIVSRINTEKLLHSLKDLFLDFIKERIFRIFPWYVPLLTMKSLQDPITELTEKAVANISLYIRESPEDGGILILSHERLEEVFLQIGCQPIDLIRDTRQWRLPE